MRENCNRMKYFEKVEKIPAEIYYHYTSLDALYSIVTSQTFRLTSLKSSNDKKELYYKSETFLEDFERVCNKELDKNTKQCFELVKESLEVHRAEFMKICKEKSYPYALCLSEKKDNLTHWDRYAAQCTGVCIGFNVSALKILMQRMAITAFGIGVYDIGKVLYSSEQKERFIRMAMVTLFNTLGRKEILDRCNILEVIKRNGFTYAASAYMQCAKFAKNDSFVDEDEVRLYHGTESIKGTLHLIDLMENDIEPELYLNLKKHLKEFVELLHLNEERFCVSSRGIRSYKELCLKEVWGEGTIPEIILGPMCVQNKNELRRFLNANGLNGTKIAVSGVPIR